jgi:hypothetical protein
MSVCCSTFESGLEVRSAVLPLKAHSPEATSQYPLPVGVAAMPTIRWWRPGAAPDPW